MNSKCFSRRRLLSLAIASATLPGLADDALPVGQQWNCQPSATNDWQCQQEAAVGKYRRSAIAASATLATGSAINEQPTTTVMSEGQRWDWLPKAQLADPKLCRTGCEGAYVEPPRDWKDAELTPGQAAIRADAAQSTSDEQSVKLSGDIHITQGHRSFRAGEATLDRKQHQLSITGNVEVREPNLLIRADSAEINTETQLGSFQQAQFLQHSSGFRGETKTLRRSARQVLELEDGSFTQCTPDDETWYFAASQVSVDINEGWGKAKHARLYIQDVPVFYTPYISFPIDDRRKSGFLWPSLASGGDNGFELSAPYYLNLGANYDATLAPRYLEKRGTMLEAELRHLSEWGGSWVFTGSDLNDDLYRSPQQIAAAEPSLAEHWRENSPPREHRWLGHISQSGQLFGLSTSINYNKASDIDYLDDFSTNNFEIKRTSNLIQQAALAYNTQSWRIQLLAEEFQVLDEDINQQYKLMPQFSIERNRSGNSFAAEWLFKAEYSDFQHEDDFDHAGNFVSGIRHFAETGLSFPMRWAPGFIIPTAKLRHLDYDLEAIAPDADESPSVTTPLGTLDMGLVFERSTSFNNNSFTQTLEPRLFYFYSDYEDQRSLPDFDTKELNFSYSQLFRDTRFSGHDRLDDANQVSIGVTSRFIENSSGREQLTLSLGQIFYFEDRRVHIDTLMPEEQAHSRIATEVQYQPHDQLWFSHSLLWDSRRDAIDEGGFALHYQGSDRSLYNIGYRFRRDGDQLNGVGMRDLSQADASLVYPLTDRWSAYARLRYDLEGKRSLDDLFGLQYEDCCWMVRLLYQQGLDDEYYNELRDQIIVERDYAFILEFQLKGLGSLGSKAVSALRNSILGYEDLE